MLAMPLLASFLLASFVAGQVDTAAKWTNLAQCAEATLNWHDPIGAGQYNMYFPTTVNIYALPDQTTPIASFPALPGAYAYFRINLPAGTQIWVSTDSGADGYFGSATATVSEGSDSSCLDNPSAPIIITEQADVPVIPSGSAAASGSSAMAVSSASVSAVASASVASASSPFSSVIVVTSVATSTNITTVAASTNVTAPPITTSARSTAVGATTAPVNATSVKAPVGTGNPYLNSGSASVVVQSKSPASVISSSSGAGQSAGANAGSDANRAYTASVLVVAAFACLACLI